MESFFSLLKEKLLDYGLDTLRERTNFKCSLEALERNLESLSIKAHDVEEEIKNAELSGKKKRKREVEDWLKHVQKIENKFRGLENEVRVEGFIRQFLSGDRVAKLNERVFELIEQSRHFGELLIDVYETRGDKLLTTQLVGEAFQQSLERIWKCLVIDKVSSIGIYGMGGIGKTTLAKHINNQLLEKTQDCVFWVTVSQVFSIKKLQDEIAHVVGLDLSDEHNEDKRAARLNQALSRRKNSVLILDDVWKNINLEKVGDPLSVEGCRLMITTRSLEVCRQIGCIEVIRVKKLQMDEAWNLFTKTLGQETILAPPVEEIAKSMVKVCDGLPLGIISIGGSMRGETAIHVWRNASTELYKSLMGQNSMEDKVFKVLRYSFDRLDSNHPKQGKSNEHTSVQLCFLYCSLYPEDYKISRGELLRKFITEELLDKRKSMRAQLDQGRSILDKLVNVCLLESSHYDCVKMHDLVRTMALNISEGSNMVIAGDYTLKTIPNEEDWTEDLEKMSLMENSIEEIPTGFSPCCRKLSTLLLQNNPLKLLPNSFFSRMYGLHNLDLSGTSIKELPNSLSELESLKTLLLGGCLELISVPYLGKLKALTELDLSGTAINEVPPGLEKLVNLKSLLMNGANHLMMLPTGLLLNFSYLQHLRLPYQIQTPVEDIEKLKQLQEFVGRVKDVGDLNLFINSRQRQGCSAFYFMLVGEGKYYFEEATLHIDYNKVILDASGLNRQDRDVIMLAHDIQQLEFRHENLNNCLLDEFPRLNYPKFLKTLRIINSEGIECILKREQFMAFEESESLFQTLEEIVLLGLPNFMDIIQKQDIGSPPPQVIFPSLRILEISYCHKMKKLRLPISELQNLEEIFVERCDGIEEIIEVVDDHRSEKGESIVISLPKLKCLHLNQLPRLKSICKVMIVCSSIETITLVKCPTLEKLPLFFTPCSTPPYYCSPPPSLREIKLVKAEKEWWKSLEWEHPTHYHLLQPFVHFL